MGMSFSGLAYLAAKRSGMLAPVQDPASVLESVPAGESVLVRLSAKRSMAKRKRVLIPRVVSFRVDGVAYAAARENEAHARWISSER